MVCSLKPPFEIVLFAIAPHSVTFERRRRVFYMYIYGEWCICYGRVAHITRSSTHICRTSSITTLYTWHISHIYINVYLIILEHMDCVANEWYTNVYTHLISHIEMDSWKTCVSYTIVHIWFNRSRYWANEKLYSWIISNAIWWWFVLNWHTRNMQMTHACVVIRARFVHIQNYNYIQEINLCGKN